MNESEIIVQRIQGDWGVAEFSISFDPFEVVLLEFQPGKRLNIEHLLNALKEQGIVYGIKERELEDIVTVAYKNGPWKGRLLIAMGTEDPLVNDSDMMTLTGDWGKAQLNISIDKMEVFLTDIELGTVRDDKQLLMDLRKSGFVHGIMLDELNEILNLAFIKQGWTGRELIAVGTWPESRGRLYFPVLDDVGIEVEWRNDEWQLPENVLNDQDLRRVLKYQKLQQVKRGIIPVLNVFPGQVLAKIEGVKGKFPGKDVFGNELKLNIELLLGTGDYVKVESDGTQITATVFGALSIQNEEISIIPPIWITPERMKAYWVNFPQKGKSINLRKEYVVTTLVELGIDSGFANKNIDQLCEKLNDGKKVPSTVEIAKGSLPKNGEDSKVEFSGDIAAEPSIREDGSIDIRAHNSVNSVKKDDLLGTQLAHTVGIAGQDLFKKPLGAVDGKEVPFAVGEGIRTEEKERGLLLYADVNGVVKFEKNILEVSEVFQIKGDINLSTGNLDIREDIVIDGSILSGFNVKTEGSVAVNGHIEIGARVQAGGNIEIAKGINGDTTTVISGGDLLAQFIQDATVISMGDIKVGSYIRNANVHAGGELTVEKRGGSRAGSVMGGNVFSAKKINIFLAGAPANPKTVIGLKPDPKSQANLDRIRSNKLACENNISKQMVQLGVNDVETLRRRMLRMPSSIRERYSIILRKLNELSKLQISLLKEEKNITLNLDKIIGDGEVKISSRVYPQVEIVIGSQTKTFQEETGGAAFRLVDGLIQTV